MLKSILLSNMLLFSAFVSQAQAQQSATSWNSSIIKSKLEKLDVLGSVLYFAAHPDDENTKLIAWLAQEKHYRTGYLSLTRGDGGQNLIGTEQGIELGLIRTQELLAARRIDQGEQFFTSAFDFGFSKTSEETFQFWEKDQVLREAVWIIRKFQPDVIITRFPPDARAGHGHHQASAILAHEAFLAAADPTKFPEQLKLVQPWQATRLVWNTFNFGNQNTTNENQLQVEIGQYNPLIGQSYGEIAAQSRSSHKSQGFGSAAQVGKAKEYFEFVAGKPAQHNPFEEIDLTWSKIQNGPTISKMIKEINTSYQLNHPEKSISKLFEVLRLVNQIDDPYWKSQKSTEIKDLIVACAGIRIESIADQSHYAEGDDIKVLNQLIVRSDDVSILVSKINQQQIDQKLDNNALTSFQTVDSATHFSQPYWLNEPNSIGRFHFSDFNKTGYPENQDYPAVNFDLLINGESLQYKKPIQYKFTDPVRGEIYNPIAVSPKVTGDADQTVLLSPNSTSQKITFTFENQSNSKNISETITPILNANWKITPADFTLNFTDTHQHITQELTIQALTKETRLDTLSFQFSNQEKVKINREINYNHIPTITWFPDLTVKISNLQLQVPIKKVGYLAGAGDLIPESLKAIGIGVEMLTETQALHQDLKRFDAIIVGIRAFNVLKSMSQISPRLMEYVKNGGTVIEQYNVDSKLISNQFGPYPFSIGRSRVTEELAEVHFDQKNPIFNYPNKISSADFDHWVQERGLYFAENIDNQYQTPIQIQDKNEPLHKGSLLIANYGSGKFVYTSLSFFRQLPAGVPGAYRLFVNLLSKSK
ncbi:PIG-L family deacetylase [Sphingobacterium sp. SRCM116780]|uniref:PIG-L family deacetylase n=1 Tax=Sphingobacterium sp. SRCM116780 TaxID=2907623 RepID=UPI001F41E96B|nr:PIG-L family deacetylase [Sphingobacterium sp. SRCM116780]UIR55775.1 PIG-L family deacetylase [Sphingobacterium sp. SRCM116780]